VESFESRVLSMRCESEFDYCHAVGGGMGVVLVLLLHVGVA